MLTGSGAAGAINLAGGTITQTGGALTFSTITGNGTINGAPTATGTIQAAGGTLDITGNIAATAGAAFGIAGTVGSVLRLDGTVGSGNAFTFAGSAGALALNATSLAGLAGTIGGLSIETGGSATVAGSNFINVQGVTITSAKVGATSENKFNGIDNTVTLYNGATQLGTVTLASAPTAGTFFDFAPDATAGGGIGAGTDLYLDSVVCYAAGTHILTPAGERAVESIRAGDSIVTQAGNDRLERRVKWVGSRRIDLTRHPRPWLAAPVRILRDGFADGVPRRDLVLSPDHAVFVDNKLICARRLINGATIFQETDRASVVYYHIELDEHAILLAEGLPAESYLDTGNRGFFSGTDEPRELYPDCAEGTPDRSFRSCAPFVSDDADVQPIWQRLAGRAERLGMDLERRETDRDPDLHVVAQDRTPRAIVRENGRHLFMLSARVPSIRVVSRSGRPTDVRPWAEDRRDLGVYVERITLTDRTGEVHDIPLDHPALSQGWWAPENCGILLRRWTNGDAVVPLPPFLAPAILEIQASSDRIAYPAGSGWGGIAAAA